MSDELSEMSDELHVVTLEELATRSEELVREVYATGEPIFIMEGDTMIARLLAPEMSLDEIRQSYARIRKS